MSRPRLAAKTSTHRAGRPPASVARWRRTARKVGSTRAKRNLFRTLLRPPNTSLGRGPAWDILHYLCFWWMFLLLLISTSCFQGVNPTLLTPVRCDRTPRQEALTRSVESSTILWLGPGWATRQALVHLAHLCPFFPARPLSEMFPSASVEALDLLRLCLQPATSVEVVDRRSRRTMQNPRSATIQVLDCGWDEEQTHHFISIWLSHGSRFQIPPGSTQKSPASKNDQEALQTCFWFWLSSPCPRRARRASGSTPTSASRQRTPCGTRAPSGIESDPSDGGCHQDGNRCWVRDWKDTSSVVNSVMFI